VAHANGHGAGIGQEEVFYCPLLCVRRSRQEVASLHKHGHFLPPWFAGKVIGVRIAAGVLVPVTVHPGRVCAHVSFAGRSCIERSFL
jgi:hypothetical protein